ncbi:MAG: VOC family protein [Saprospiraceae bacterium]|nr:VOC family protein [Saprospiraceae bacterium]
MITQIIPKLPFIQKSESLDFYVRILGFTLMSDYGDYLLLKRDGLEIHLFHFPSLQPTASDFMIYLRVDEGIEAMFACIESEKVRKLYPLEQKTWGQKEFSVIDPSGTLLTFGQASR